MARIQRRKRKKRERRGSTPLLLSSGDRANSGTREKEKGRMLRLEIENQLKQRNQNQYNTHIELECGKNAHCSDWKRRFNVSSNFFQFLLGFSNYY
jgi:ERCC4-related helicase